MHLSMKRRVKVKNQRKEKRNNVLHFLNCIMSIGWMILVLVSEMTYQKEKEHLI